MTDPRKEILDKLIKPMMKSCVDMMEKSGRLPVATKTYMDGDELVVCEITADEFYKTDER